MKECLGCNRTLPFSNFAKRSAIKSGLQSKCKECNKKYRQANSIAVKANIDSWRLKNPKYDQTRYQNKKEEFAARKSHWQKSNPEHAAALARMYRAKKMNQLGVFPKNHEEIMIEIYGIKRCFKCLTSEKIEIDHIKPVSVGGEWCLLNFQFLCRSCNSSKSNKEIDYRTKEDKSNMIDKVKELILCA